MFSVIRGIMVMVSLHSRKALKTKVEQASLGNHVVSYRGPET